MGKIARYLEQQRAKEEAQQAMKDRINRQSSLVAQNSIVLWDDFYEHAVQPALQSGRVFQHIFGRDGLAIKQHWARAVRSNNATSFPIDYTKLSFDTKARIDERIRKGVIEEFENDDPLTQTEFESFVRAARQDFQLDAVYIKEIMAAMDACRGPLGDRGIFRYEEKSLRRNQGNAVVNFWEAVSKLEPYNNRVSDPPDPKGPGGPPVGVIEWIGTNKGNKGGAFKPAWA